MAEKTVAHRRTADSLSEYGRGLAGGLIFSLPLLYTMEVWWAGFIAGPERIALFTLATFVLLLGYNRYAGMRRDSSFLEVVVDSIEELGLGIVTAAGVLFLLGRITTSTPLEELIGKIMIEAGVVAIGFSVGTAQLGTREGEEESGLDNDDDDGEWEGSLRGELIIAFCGAILFAANVGPTEEIEMIAYEIGSIRSLALAVVSIILGAMVLFFCDFRAASPRTTNSFRNVFSESVMTYAVALVASAAILLLFNRFEGLDPAVCASEIIVLGLPAVLGAAAGRLLLKGSQ